MTEFFSFSCFRGNLFRDKRAIFFRCCLVFGLIINLNIAFPDYNQQIEFKGNRLLRHPERFVNFLKNTLVNDSLIQIVKTALLSEYSRQGFFWANVSVETIADKGHNKLVFQINENEQARISEIELIGYEKIPLSKLTPLLKSKTLLTSEALEKSEGDSPRPQRSLQLDFPFYELIFTTQVQTLLTYYENNGFPFVTIEPKNFNVNDSERTISYTLKITEGPLVRIGKINFTGTETKESRMQQLFSFKPLTLFSEDITRKLLRKVQAQGFTVTDYNIIQFDTTYQLQISVKEKMNQEISAAISYLPYWREFNGFFYLNLSNLLYTLRRVKLGWEKFNRFTNFSLNYQDPYLLSFKLTSNIAHTVYDTSYAKTDFNLGINIPVLEYLSLNFYTGYDNTTPGLLNLSTFQTIWFGQGFTIENYNESDNRDREYWLDYSTNLGSRKQSPQNQLLAKTIIESTLLFPIIRNIGYLINLTLKNLYSNTELSISDSLYLGGTRTLRGYRENEFSTNRFLLLRNEFYFLRSSNTNFFLFGDFACFNSSPHYLFKSGYGLGLSANTKTAIIEISYGIPLQENILRGKIHLGLSNKF